MTEKMYKVISKECKSGVGRDGRPYCFESLIICFNGKPARISAPRDFEVNIGEQVKLGFGTRKGCGCAEICPVITEVIPAEAKGE